MLREIPNTHPKSRSYKQANAVSRQTATSSSHPVSRAQRWELKVFRQYLEKHGVRFPKGATRLWEAEAWQSITADMVQKFIAHRIDSGAAVNTVNQSLSTIKRYARLAVATGVLHEIELAKIYAIHGLRIVGNVVVSKSDIARLQDCPDTPQGRRDRLLINLLCNHGIPVTALANLQVHDIHLPTGTLRMTQASTAYRQCYQLSAETIESLFAYLYCIGAPQTGWLLRSSNSNGRLANGKMSPRAIHKRVSVLGMAAGIEKLTPRILHNYWQKNNRDYC